MRRLLYVTCSRAEESLAMVIYTTQPATAKQRVIEAGWLQQEEIEILWHPLAASWPVTELGLFICCGLGHLSAWQAIYSRQVETPCLEPANSLGIDRYIVFFQLDLAYKATIIECLTKTNIKLRIRQPHSSFIPQQLSVSTRERSQYR